MVMPILSANAFGIHIGGWLGGKINDVKNLVTGGPGGPLDLATKSTIDNLGDKLNQSIDSLDRVMGRNAREFSKQLGANIAFFDTILKLREEQLGTLLNKSVDELNTGLSKNIDKLDESIDVGVTRLTSVSSFFSKGLWTTSKLIADLALLLIVIYFIFQTYSHIKKHGGLNKKEYKELLLESKFYLVGLGLGLFVIFLFRPLTNKFVDKDFERQRTSYENTLSESLRQFDYVTAGVYSRKLNALEPQNELYDYLQKKIKLISYFLLQPRDVQAGDESLSSLYGYFKAAKVSGNIYDVDYYLISALFERNYHNSKEGYLLAAADTYEYLKRKNHPDENLKFKFYLEPYAYDILNNYYLAPPSKQQIVKTLTDDSVKYDDALLHTLTRDTIFESELVAYPFLHLNQLAFAQLRQDQSNLELFLKDANNSKLKDNAVTSWIDLVRFANASKFPKVYIDKALIFNDFIAYGMLQNYRHHSLDSLAAVCTDILSNSGIEKSIQDSLNNVFVFKRFLIAKVLSNTTDPEAKAVKVRELLSEKDFFYNKIDSFKIYYFAMKNSASAKRSDADQLETYKNLIRLASELNLYHTKYDARSPMSYDYIDKARLELPLLFQQNPNLSVELKNESDRILENNFWSY
jgi:hypothetical protein